MAGIGVVGVNGGQYTTGSFAMYNTLDEVDVLVKAVARAADMLR